jgi:adenylate cyclase
VKLRYSVGIATKIIFMVTLIIIGAIGVVMHITTDLFREESVTRVQETNKDLAEALSERMLVLFEDVREKMTVMAQFAVKGASDTEGIKAIQDILKRSDDLISFSVYKFNEKGEPIHQFTEVNTVAAAEFNLKSEDFHVKPLPAILTLHKKRVMDDFIAMNSSWIFKAPLLSMSFLSQREASPKPGQEPVVWSNQWLSGRWLFRADLREDSLMRLFSKKKHIAAYMVDGAGRLMAHSDPAMLKNVIEAMPMSTSPIVYKMMVEKNLNNHQMEYWDQTGETFFGAYKKVGVSGIGVVTQVKQKDALATIEKVQYRSGLVMLTVVCLAFLINFFLSKSITYPLKTLFLATQNILEGRYDVKLKVRSSDEVGALSKAFLNMAAGLKEREKLKGAFNKFHSKEVAKKLLSGEIKLGGERRQATVFFSDIRGFTAISERMSPDQVVLLLNEYMSEMVKIIYNWKGVVDKYMGDAIMAVWGVPETAPEDAYNAVRAALEMREFLGEWNRKRSHNGKVEIKIGIGLASGDLLAGNIGSEHRLEYTVIGDTVNQASRIEGGCKPLHTDLLIGHSTYTLVHHLGIVSGPEIHIRAKGKTEDLIVHQVIGYKDQNGLLHTVFTPEEVEEIQKSHVTVEPEQEDKTSLASTNYRVHDANTPTPLAGPTSIHPYREPPPTLPESRWYVVPDVTSRESQGPYTLKELGFKVAQRQVDFNRAYVFEEGKNNMMPLAEMMGLNRRADTPIIQAELPETVVREAASADEWYIHGHQGETMGPYSVLELELALSRGNLTRTTYVWRKGLPNWIYLYQIPDFDRRSRKIA